MESPIWLNQLIHQAVHTQQSIYQMWQRQQSVNVSWNLGPPFTALWQTMLQMSRRCESYLMMTTTWIWFPMDVQPHAEFALRDLERGGVKDNVVAVLKYFRNNNKHFGTSMLVELYSVDPKKFVGIHWAIPSDPTLKIVAFLCKFAKITRILSTTRSSQLLMTYTWLSMHRSTCKECIRSLWH